MSHFQAKRQILQNAFTASQHAQRYPVTAVVLRNTAQKQAVDNAPAV